MKYACSLFILIKMIHVIACFDHCQSNTCWKCLIQNIKAFVIHPLALVLLSAAGTIINIQFHQQRENKYISSVKIISPSPSRKQDKQKRKNRAFFTRFKLKYILKFVKSTVQNQSALCMERSFQLETSNHLSLTGRSNNISKFDSVSTTKLSIKIISSK